MKMDYLIVEGKHIGIKVEYEDKNEREVMSQNRDYFENLFDELIEDAKSAITRRPQSSQLLR